MRIQKYCGTSSGVAVAALDAVAVVEGDDADVLEQLVVRPARGAPARRSRSKSSVRRGSSRLSSTPRRDVRARSARACSCLELVVGLVVAEHALVDGLEQQAGGDGVEGRVVFDVLQGDLDDGLVELLGGDAVEEGELELARDLGDPGDVLVEARAGVLDREVDLVGVVRLALLRCA